MDGCSTEGLWKPILTNSRIAADLKKPFVLDGIYRTDDTPIHVAVREALANCLSNADFLLSGSVVIRKYPDKIVLSNPGTIRLGKNRCFGAENHSRVTN